MIKFEEHDGMLFRMLEKPVPLTPDAEMPCLTRLIQDDSRMGMFNRDTKPSRLSDFYLVARIVSNNIVVDEFMESDYNRFEIIGTPVAEGSAEWALYQMMQGIIVRHPNGKPIYLNGEYVMVEGGFALSHIKDFLSKTEPSGWQLYELKPEQPKYKVGDWVEWCGDQYMVESAPPQSGGRYDIRSPYDELGCSVYPENITRKLSPSEVIVRIGCLSGTVEDLSYASDGRFWLIGKATERCQQGMFVVLYDEMLDTETRELVEDLLKAQDEEK